MVIQTQIPGVFVLHFLNIYLVTQIVVSPQTPGILTTLIAQGQETLRKHKAFVPRDYRYWVDMKIVPPANGIDQYRIFLKSRGSLF
jgi:hypothetical protein